MGKSSLKWELWEHWEVRRTSIVTYSEKQEIMLVGEEEYLWNFLVWQCGVSWECPLPPKTTCEQNNVSDFDTGGMEKYSGRVRGWISFLGRGTVKIHCSNGHNMSRYPSSVADRWFGPTGTRVLQPGADSENRADWRIGREGRADRAVVDRSGDERAN